jgi:hypothetical protein
MFFLNIGEILWFVRKTAKSFHGMSSGTPAINKKKQPRHS